MSAVLALDFLLGRKSILLFVLNCFSVKRNSCKENHKPQGLELTHEREGQKLFQKHWTDAGLVHWWVLAVLLSSVELHHTDKYTRSTSTL